MLRRLARIRRGKTVVLTGGTFDILHPGHLRFLRNCKREGDVLVVCVAGDARTRRRKGAGRPVMPAIQRAELVANLKMVNLAFVSERRPFDEHILGKVRPNVLVTSKNEPSDSIKQQFLEYMKSKHPEIRVSLTQRFHESGSSSELIQKLGTRKWMRVDIGSTPPELRGVQGVETSMLPGLNHGHRKGMCDDHTAIHPPVAGC